MPKKNATPVEVGSLPERFYVSDTAANNNGKIHTGCCRVVQAYATKHGEINVVKASSNGNNFCEACSK